MDFKELMPDNEEDADNAETLAEQDSVENRDKIGPNQFYGIITGNRHDWSSILLDLIHTEQLDPWDIDIVILTHRYFEKIAELEEADFYVSSKVLLAAAFLLRIKSEFLLNRHIKSIDDILFGRKEESKKEAERIEIDEEDLPVLIPKTPMPRARRVTLTELMSALNKAINTESRRIRREVAIKRAEKLSEVDFPKFQRIDLKDRIKQFYAKVLTSISKRAVNPNKELNRVGYSELIGLEREERLACFLPLLHLSNTKKLWLEQERHLEEIWIFLHKYFETNREKFVEELEEDIEAMEEELAEEEVEGEKASGIENARQKLAERRQMEEEIAKELEEEIIRLKEENKIDEVTGFSDE
jgi:segregation and condensation protein A